MKTQIRYSIELSFRYWVDFVFSSRNQEIFARIEEINAKTIVFYPCSFNEMYTKQAHAKKEYR
jgi:hypothetical protein